MSKILIPQSGDVSWRLTAEAVAMNRLITAIAALLICVATAPLAKMHPQNHGEDRGWSLLQSGLIDRLSPEEKSLFLSDPER